MRKEPAENMAVLKETCWQLYPTIKGMFLYYSALDVDVFLKLSRAQQKSVKVGAHARGLVPMAVKAIDPTCHPVLPTV
jgi:hypothetical protein